MFKSFRKTSFTAIKMYATLLKENELPMNKNEALAWRHNRTFSMQLPTPAQRMSKHTRKFDDVVTGPIQCQRELVSYTNNAIVCGFYFHHLYVKAD